jgi:hypothetical protein
MRRRESVLDVYNLVLGFFLFLSPWMFAYTQKTADTDIWASALIICVASIVGIVAFSKWVEWTNLLLGLWLMISPWVLGFAHTKAMHISIGLGVAVAYLAALELFLLYEASSRAPASH